ncbi:MAG: hypothetical protein U5K74_13530 [Gemmatimonadaceae bacterium]|nr:hypothetical protein [Gemmatimonadaceae bacterium]
MRKPVDRERDLALDARQHAAHVVDAHHLPTGIDGDCAFGE